MCTRRLRHLVIRRKASHDPVDILRLLHFAVDHAKLLELASSNGCRCLRHATTHQVVLHVLGSCVTEIALRSLICIVVYLGELLVQVTVERARVAVLATARLLDGCLPLTALPVQMYVGSVIEVVLRVVFVELYLLGRKHEHGVISGTWDC